MANKNRFDIELLHICSENSGMTVFPIREQTFFQSERVTIIIINHDTIYLYRAFLKYVYKKQNKKLTALRNLF